MATIIITNISASTISINDLGLVLESTESVDISELFSDEEILESNDLQSQFNSGSISIDFDSTSVSHSKLIELLTNLSVAEHESLDTLKHGLSEQSYFEVLKDAEDRTQFITNWTDSTKTKKIREEEIVRTQTGQVDQIIIKQYDNQGTVVGTETQQLNRTIEGSVESINSTTA